MRYLLCLFCIVAGYTAYAQAVTLDSNWQFNFMEQWHPATVPGTIHTDLLANGLIEDPFFGDREKDLQWIGKRKHRYRCSFDVKENFRSYKEICLQFDGLDTYASIFLNGKLIGKTNNMFRRYRFNVRKNIRPVENILEIIFESAEEVSDQLSIASDLKYPCENNRNFARKAQFHFGWDWAPRYLTCGIWRKVSLLYGDVPKDKPARYSKVKLVREKDSIGTSFYFTVDGKPTFMKGANWIPADVFLPRVSKHKYRELLLAAKDAGFNMLRVWGGGVYEDDYFYTLCDSLGIYVWQDFMFAGAMYPLSNGMLENIRQEAIDNIVRLRHHPCIVLWCGNNEISEAWNNWGWQKQFSISPRDSALLWARYDTLFNQVLPALVSNFDHGRDYIPSSPLHGWGRNESMTDGDSHYWGLWWGLQPIEIMKQKVPRFMSEFGMQAMPVMQSIREYALAGDMDTASAVMRAHQKHPTGYSTLARYMKMEGLSGSSFIAFVQSSQELQRNVISTALKAQMNSGGRCMGSLLWQFNDCWPVCSWSVIDYYGRKKKGYYEMKKAFAGKPE